jgi:hypothetical protein
MSNRHVIIIIVLMPSKIGLFRVFQIIITVLQAFSPLSFLLISGKSHRTGKLAAI